MPVSKPMSGLGAAAGWGRLLSGGGLMQPLARPASLLEGVSRPRRPQPPRRATPRSAQLRAAPASAIPPVSRLIVRVA